jgi:hypothetical protein
MEQSKLIQRVLADPKYLQKVPSQRPLIIIALDPYSRAITKLHIVGTENSVGSFPSPPDGFAAHNSLGRGK